MVTLTPGEFDQLSPAAKKLHLKNEERLVYGENVKHDKTGKPVQDGIGSPGHETANHFAALLKREKEGEERPGSYMGEVNKLWARDPKKAKALNLPPPDRDLEEPKPRPRKAKPKVNKDGATMKGPNEDAL